MPNRFSPAAVLALVVLLVPVLVMITSLYGQYGMFFWDARTIPCGIQAMLRAGDPNAYLNNPDYPGACAGYGYEYMLPPAVTVFLTGAVRLIGVEALNAVYFVLYAASVAFLAWCARRYGATTRELLFFFGLLGCGVFVFEVGGGNITVVFLAGLFALLASEPRNPRWALWSVLLCSAASALKPVYALYLFVPLFAGGQWLAVAAASAAVTVAYALDAWLQPAAFAQWLNLIVPVVYAEPHFGIMRIMQWLGLGAGDWLAQGGGYVLWCGVIMGLLWLARPGLATPRDRAFAALLAVTLMQPRLKEYDAFVLIPLFFWLRTRLPVSDRLWMERVLFAVVFLAPALWWWYRKAVLLATNPSPAVIQVADPKWLIATQGFVLAITALVMFGFLVRPYLPSRRAAACGSAGST